jgi:transposase
MTYYPASQTPELECDCKNKQYVSISSVISTRGKPYFDVREMEGFKRKGLTRFLDNMKKKIREKLLLVWDNASSHKSKTIKKYLNDQDAENPRIWMENIPPYCPEINPIEQVWGCLKEKMKNQFFSTTSALKKAVQAELKKISDNKKLIISFFKNKELECYHFFS